MSRCVWLTDEQRAELGRIYALQPPAVISQIVGAWDAAPADPVEAMHEAYHDYTGPKTVGELVAHLARALGWEAS